MNRKDESNNERKDEIVKQVRATREAYAAQFDFDLAERCDRTGSAGRSLWSLRSCFARRRGMPALLRASPSRRQMYKDLKAREQAGQHKVANIAPAGNQFFPRNRG